MIDITSKPTRKPQVFFVGAGPGDFELLTLKAYNLIKSAQLIIYTGSLVPKNIFAKCQTKAQLIDSAPLTLDAIGQAIFAAVQARQLVVRVHTGDAAIFGTLREEMTILTAAGIKFKIVPGVTAASAAAAKANISFTLPEICQTLMITRLSGRTLMPPLEQLASLATHKTSMAIYLAGGRQRQLQAELLQAGLAKTTPIFCAHRLGFEDEYTTWLTLENLDQFDKENKYAHQTIFLVLPAEEHQGAASKLYSPNFSHNFRQN